MVQVGIQVTILAEIPMERVEMMETQEEIPEVQAVTVEVQEETLEIQKEMVEQQEIILEHLTEVETLRKAMVALSTFQSHQSIPAILKI